MSGDPEEPGEGTELVLYETRDHRTRIDVRLHGGTVWLSQAQLADLFQTTVANINIHLKAIYAEGEIPEDSTIKDYLIVRSEGRRQVSREILHYSLEAIIAVGYRVHSPRGTQFRQWATARLNEYLVKGFTLDDERMANPAGPGTPDYFDELLERIRAIRASERRMYLRVRDILALAADYAPRDEETKLFFRTIQNKLHSAVTGKTAPELIAERVDDVQPNMGLTTWKGDVVRKSDVTVAKNYLREPEIGELNRIVNMFLDFAEDQARRRKQVFIRDWEARVDEFLRFNDRNVLHGAGSVSRETAEERARDAYEKYAQRRQRDDDAALEAEHLNEIGTIARKLPSRRKGAPE